MCDPPLIFLSKQAFGCLLEILYNNNYVIMHVHVGYRYQSEPYVIMVGSNKNPEQAFLVMDRKVLTEINPEEIPVYLIAVFYV